MRADAAACAVITRKRSGGLQHDPLGQRCAIGILASIMVSLETPGQALPRIWLARSWQSSDRQAINLDALPEG